MNRETGVIAGIAAAAIIAVGIFFAVTSSNQSGTSGPKVDQAVLERSDSYAIGPKDAKVTIVEFGDYQCPACGAAYPLLKQLMTNHADVRLVFRNFPLSQHANAKLAAKAALAAGLQGKYWEMHDKLYETQNSWAESTDARDVFIADAANLGLSKDQFGTALDSNTDLDARISSDLSDGNSLGVNSTPTLYFNGLKYSGSLTLSDFEKSYQAAAK